MSKMIDANAEVEALKLMQAQLETDGMSYGDYVIADKYAKTIYDGSKTKSITIPFLKTDINAGMKGTKGVAKAKFGDLD